MTFRLDHVVIAVEDLASAAGDYRALGFTVQPGGRHPGRTSHNALVVFEDGAYLELIAWPEPGPAERWYNELVQHGEGFMDFALIPDDIALAMARSKARGLTLKGPIDGGRVRPDGKVLKWQTGRQATFDLPFLCADVTPRALRVPEGEVRRHANGAMGIASVTVAVDNLAASLARYEALLGTEADPLPSMEQPAGLRKAAIVLEGCTLVLATPSGSARSTFDHEVRSRLASRGDGPCALAIGSVTGQAATLDLAAAHGARIEVVPLPA